MEKRACEREPYTPSPAHFQEERLCLPGISSTRPPTPTFALCHTTREGFVFICTAKPPPHAPRSHSKNPRGAGSAVQIRLEVAGYTGGAAGSEDRGSEAVALWQNLGTLGATQALQGRASALRHAGVCGR